MEWIERRTKKKIKETGKTLSQYELAVRGDACVYIENELWMEYGISK